MALNPQNLNPVRTKEEARRRGRNGGIKSGEARRKKKSLLSCAKRVLESDMPEKVADKIERLTGDLEPDEDTVFTAGVAVMMNKAINGDVRAFNAVKDLVLEIEGAIAPDTVEDDGLSESLEQVAAKLKGEQ